MSWVYRRPAQAQHRQRRRFVAVAGGAAQSIAVGTANESEAAVAVGIDLTVLVGVASETETAQAVGIDLTVLVGEVAEVETAQIVLAKQGEVIAVGQASETETAQIIGIGLGVGQTAEVETAQPVAPDIVVVVGVASESEAAGIIGIKLGVGQAAEVEAVTPVLVGGAQSIAVVAVAESETAQPIVIIFDFTLAVGLASEFESARPVVNPDVGLSINPFQNGSLAPIFLLSPLQLDTTAGRDARQVRFVGWFFKSTPAEAHTVREELITIMKDLQEVKITYDGEPGYNGTYFIRRARVDSAKIGPGLYQYQIDAQYVGVL